MLLATTGLPGMLSAGAVLAAAFATTGLSAVFTAALASAYLGVGDPAGEGCLGLTAG